MTRKESMKPSPPPFDFGPDYRCGDGTLHALILSTGEMVLACDEDDAIYDSPGEILAGRPSYPVTEALDLGSGRNLRADSWRYARREEVASRG